MRKTKTLGIIAVIAVIGLMVINCENGTLPGDDGALPIVRSRYETVPYNSAGFGRSAAGDEPYVLVSSGKAHDDSVDYYLYYMGYVKTVPVSYKTAYRYDGTTPITIAYEKSWITEEAIVESMTTAKDKTWSMDTSATAGVEIGGQAGLAPFATTSIKVSVSTTIGSGYAETISTSNTYETSKTKIEGETESISATVGEHGESAGRYRYALFGTTDVYCLFAVDPETRKIQSITVSNLAREASYAWGIDYSADDSFGKTGTGDLFKVPDIDFSEIESPTEKLEAPPAPPPPETIRTTFSASTGTKQTGATRTSGGDDDIGSEDGKKTNWSLEVTNIQLINKRSDGTYSDVSMNFVYTVSEGKSNWTVLRMDVSHTFSLANKKVIELVSSTKSTRTGSITGKTHSFRDLGSWNDGVIRSVTGQIDGGGGDKNNLRFNAQIHLEFIERNPAYTPEA
jgi:hypothetical protein